MNIKKRAEELLGAKIAGPRIVRDTSEFLRIDRGDVLELEGRLFVIKGVMFEGRFGLDDEPKPWVKTGLDLEDGAPKVLKLVFFEEFDLHLGGTVIRRYRSPAKEARVLEIVRDHPLFMHGQTLRDAAGNPVRVIERISGKPLFIDLEPLGLNHRQYTQGHLRGVLEKAVESIRAIKFLHDQAQRHGDIRRDHIFVENDTGLWRWIDFDYNYDQMANPFGLDLFGLGNVLCHLIGAGIPTSQSLAQSDPQALARLDEGDMSLVLPHRVFNLRKVYPHIPEELNRVLMHFTASTPVFYERVDELLDELLPAMESLPPATEEAQCPTDRPY